MKRRFLSVLLALVMCLSLLPTAALAAEDELTASTKILYDTTYKLTGDVTLKGENELVVNPGCNATLDLNGHVLIGCGTNVIDYAGTSIAGSDPATLTLIDSDPTKEHYFTVDSDGRWSLCTTEGCTHATCRKVTGGCIVGNGSNLCVVKVDRIGKTFIMEGGNLIGSQHNSSIGVQVNGSFIMKGGSIQGCRSSSSGSVTVAPGAQITLGGDSNKTVTIEDTSVGKSGVWLNNAAPAAKLTVDVMKDGSSFTVSRGGGAKLTYVGDLDLTSDPLPTLPTGVSWDSSKNELTLNDVYCGTVKLPNLEPKDTTIKGRGYADWVGCVGTASGKLIFDDADFEVGSIMWHDTNGEDDQAVVLQNDSHLTVSGEDGMYIGCLKIEDTSELKLVGSKIMSLFEGRIDDLKYYLADGTGYAAVKPEDPQQGVDYTLTRNGSTVTNETFRHYCTVTFYPGARGVFAEGTKTELRVPYGSTVEAEAPDVTPLPSYSTHIFAGWDGEGKTNGQTVNNDVKITDKIEYDVVEFTARLELPVTESFDYTNNVVLGGTAKPTAQDFELEVINSYQEPITTATVGGNKTQVTATTTFTTTDITQAALDGTLTLKGLAAQLAVGGGTFPCFVRQKDVTADGWTTATEAYLLAYDTQIEQGEEEEPPTEYPVEGGGGANPLRLATLGDTTGSSTGEEEDDPATPDDPPTLKIYPAESGEDAVYHVTKNDDGIAVPVDRMTFTNTYTGYTVTWDVNGGDTSYTPTGATTSGTVGTTITAPTSAPERSGYDFDGWYSAAEGGTKLGANDKIGNGDVTYYAHWVKTPIYNVNWDVNGGDASYVPTDATTSGAVGTTITAPTNDPTRAADASNVYTFDGWYTAAEGGDALTNTSTIPARNVTYYAQWVKTPICTVTWDVNGGDTPYTPTGATTSGAAGTTITAPTNDPTRAADASNVYTFDGWYTAATGGTKLDTTTATIPQGGATYYAHWVKTPIYTVTWNVNGGDEGYTPTGATTSGAAGTTITAPSNDPTRAADASNVYTFDGWYTEKTGGTKLDASATIPQGGATYYAHWNETPICTVTWDVNGGDTPYTPTGATTSGAVGTTITAPSNDPTRAADASNVYTFDGWYTAAEDGDALTNTSTIPARNVTYYAHWVKTPICTVTFESNGGSAVSPQKVKSGDKATEPTDPTKSGYSFGGWYSDANLSSAYDFETAVTGNLTLYARWMSNSSGTRYTIKASAGEGGSITPSGNVSVRRGADRSFTITPALGYAVRSVLVDGKEVGALTSYSFKNVRANHTISVTFQCNLPTGLNYLDHTAYVQGYPDGTVLPNGNITRAETAMMLYRLLTAERRAEIETSDCDFTDVSADAWYRTAAATMAAGGYLEGYADGSFGGDRSITRAEFIAALVRFLGVRDVTCSFSDVPASHWAYAYIATATDAGWINGANGAFRPDDPITRAEAMAVINRALCRGVDAESELLTFKGYPDNVFGAWYYYEVLEATNGHEYTGARPSEDWTRLF